MACSRSRPERRLGYSIEFPPAYQLLKIHCLSGPGFTSAIVVKTDGAVAWIVEYPVEGGATNYEVHALNETGAPRLLASATNIGPTSLALAGSNLYWSQGGQAASALLD